MKLLIRIKIITSLFIAPFTLAQSVDELIRKNFTEVENEAKDGKAITSVMKNVAPDNSTLKTFGQRDIFNFNKVDASEINGFNGKANITLPIYEINQDGLSIPIQLSYNSGGVKVDQFATEVGLGWSLDAGPVINKEILGIPDYKSLWNKTQAYGLQEYQYGYLTPDPSWGPDAPDLYNIDIKGGLASFYVDKSFNPVLISPYNGLFVSLTHGRLDEQLVKKYGFYKNYSGVSGVCSSRPKVPTYLLGYYSDYQCENIFRTYNETKSIDITFDKYTYSFKDADYTIPFSTVGFPSVCPPNSGPCYRQVSNTTERYINKYNITTIKNNLTQKNVNFYYEELAGSNRYIRNSKIFNLIEPGVNDDIVIPSKIVDGYKTDYDIYIKRLISKIVTDKEQIEFVYLKGREDSKSLDIILDSPTNFTTYYKDPLLSKIHIKDLNNTIINTYSFNYGYFDSQCTSQNLQRNPEQCKRLKLISVVKSKNNNTSNEKEEYKFHYYEDTPLPQIGSYTQDPFGYKSSLSDAETTELDPVFQAIVPKKPKVFLYEDGINNSNDKLYYLSSIKIPSLNPTSDTGYEQALSNLSNSRAWSLKTIEYPTKGKQYFNYELNSFSWRGNIVQGGGIRVSQIDIVDGSSSYSTKYTYENGNVLSLPTYNGHVETSYASTNAVSARSQDFYSKLYPIKGSIVTYDKVTKIIDNKGKTINEYTSISDFPLKMDARHNPTNAVISLYPYYYGIGNPKFNFLLKKDFIGNIKNEYIYDKNNVLLKETNVTYSNQETPFPNNYPLIKNLSSYPVFDRELEYNYYPVGYPGGYNSNPKLTYLPENYQKLRNNVIRKKTTNYFTSGNVTSTDNYSYLNEFNAIKNATNISPSETISLDFLYPFEAGAQANGYMANDNRYKYIRIGTVVNRNSKFISGQLNIFPEYFPNKQTENLVLPLSVKSYDIQNSMTSDEVTYDKYDSKGNLLQYTTKEGIPVTILWGYKNTLPIVKIEGISYNKLMSELYGWTVDPDTMNAPNYVNLSNIDTDAASEQNLQNALDSFRNDPYVKNYLVTTYTYDPLVGIKSVTPPSGIRKFYIYDNANRLKEVRENNATGKLLKEMEYNFKN